MKGDTKGSNFIIQGWWPSVWYNIVPPQREKGLETLPNQEQELKDLEEGDRTSDNMLAAWKEWTRLPARALRAPGAVGRELSVPWRESHGLFWKRISLRPRTVLIPFPYITKPLALSDSERHQNAFTLLTLALIKSTHNDNKLKNALISFFKIRIQFLDKFSNIMKQITIIITAIII